ncbi:MAG: DUF2493 domain-containing protein [Clostridia bacterium]|nr:DUF2493 domain-containing protein [Clostridia bacterium]
MEIRIVIAGSRTFNNYKAAKIYIDNCISKIRKQNKIIIISGGSRGADSLGERYAKENKMQVELYPAEWNKYGKSAGPKRNEKMAQICNFVICFWDGKSRGTKSMIDYAKKYEKPIRIINIANLK